MLGLRLTSGVDTVAFERRFGASSLSRRGRAIRELIADGMLERRGALLRVPAAELFRLDAVLTRLLA
jgi:coproporphyrinogen III oxidase-like Fe-S oxidoreductase